MSLTEAAAIRRMAAGPVPARFARPRFATHNGVVIKRLLDAEIEQWCSSRPEWERHDDEIRRRFERPSFADAIAFVVRIGFLAEAADHHPDLDIRWRTVVVALTTHDSGGLTRRDLELAASIDGIAE